MPKENNISLSILIPLLLIIMTGCAGFPKTTEPTTATHSTVKEETKPASPAGEKIHLPQKSPPIRYPEVLSREDFILRKKRSHQTDQMPSFTPSVPEKTIKVIQTTLDELNKGLVNPSSPE